MPHASKSTQLGFSLVELMIVVAIIGILSAIAIPAYNDYIIRSKLAEAKSTLMEFRVRLEQYYLDNRDYGPGGNGADCTDEGGGVVRVPMTPTTNFTYQCLISNGGQGYDMTATGLNNVAAFSLTLDEGNNRTTGSVGAGWILPAPNTCWINGRGGAC